MVDCIREKTCKFVDRVEKEGETKWKQLTKNGGSLIQKDTD